MERSDRAIRYGPLFYLINLCRCDTRAVLRFTHVAAPVRSKQGEKQFANGGAHFGIYSQKMGGRKSRKLLRAVYKDVEIQILSDFVNTIQSLLLLQTSRFGEQWRRCFICCLLWCF